ncbi:hypothetical protein ACJQWK_04479 [Exserohilum turcicum]
MAKEFTPEPRPKHNIQVTYITNCIKRMQAEAIESMEVKEEPITQLYEHMDEFHKRSVWSDKCQR